jgi:hypothetical protein
MKNSARGELVERCELWVSVVNTHSEQTRKSPKYRSKIEIYNCRCNCRPRYIGASLTSVSSVVSTVFATGSASSKRKEYVMIMCYVNLSNRV